MATTVSAIAASAFSAVAASITDAVLSGTLNDGTTDYTGRVVFGGETAPTGFPMPTAKDKMRPAYLEGFSAVPGAGWTLTADNATYYIGGVRDVVEAGSFFVANVVKSTDILWQTATFERLTLTTDGAGGSTEGWAAIAGAENISIGLVAMSGSLRYQSQRSEAQSNWQVFCLPVSGLTEKDRLDIGGRKYRIAFVNDVEKRGVWQVLDVVEGMAT